MNSEDVQVSEPENATPAECLTSELMKVFMKPPPPKNPNRSEDNSSGDSGPLSTETLEAQPNHLANETEVIRDPVEADTDQSSALVKHQQRQSIGVPYEIPTWSQSPCHRYFLEVLKEGSIIDQLHVSTRLYIFQGPSELMRPESDLKSIRKAKMRDEMQDMEASVLRAKREASLAGGISWGMGEDMIEEADV